MDINLGKAVKAGIGYTIGNTLIKGINFIAVPLFSRIMTTEEFGIYSVFISCDAILFVIIGMALHSSIKSAQYEFRGKINEYTSSISLIYLINLLVLALVSVLFGSSLSILFKLDKIIILMLVFHSFGSSVLTLYNSRISLEYSYKQYLLVAFINSFGNIVVSLFLMFTVFHSNHAMGRIIGITITTFILSVILLGDLYRKAIPHYNKYYWNFGIKYSLPIIPHGISQTLLAQFDRIMIKILVSYKAAAIYSLAGNIKLILTVIMDSVTTAWGTWIFAEMDQGNIKCIQEKSKQLSLLFVIFTVGLMSISPELILILGGVKYETGKFVAIPMVLDAFLLFLYGLIVPSEYYKKKTTYIMWGTMMAAIINLITNYIFIKQYGFIAAAYTTLFSYCCYLILHLIISYCLIKFFVIPIKTLILSIIIVSICAILDIVFVENILIRYFICAVIIIPIAIALIKYIRFQRI